MPSQSRKHRGYASEKMIARWFQGHGWVFAEATGAGRQGRDLTGTPGVSVEIKSRAGFSPLSWLRQTEAAAGGDLPIVILRCNGQGETNVGEWGVMLRLSHMTELLKSAGYIPSEVE